MDIEFFVQAFTTNPTHLHLQREGSKNDDFHENMKCKLCKTLSTG